MEDYGGDVGYPHSAPPWRNVPNHEMMPHGLATSLDGQKRYSDGGRVISVLTGKRLDWGYIIVWGG